MQFEKVRRTKKNRELRSKEEKKIKRIHTKLVFSHQGVGIKKFLDNIEACAFNKNKEKV